MGKADQDVEITLDLLKKYDRPGPRYTSYPTAVEFTEEFTEADYREKLARADERGDDPLSFYVHLPFCEERCTYCGCNVVITKKREVATPYLEHLHREIDMLAERLPGRRRLTQYHWGGGTPTYLSVEQIAALQRKVTEHFEIDSEGEVAIEVDPRVTSREQIDLLREVGFNRLSMGVQDFNPDVQEIVNRRQTEEETRRLYEYCRSKGFGSINLDLIYGLALQTPESFAATIKAVIEMRPERVALYSYAFVPWLKAHQRKIEVDALPPPEVKIRLFCIARAMFLEAGYAQIGMDHFALPEDELVHAMQRKRLHRNFMGYTVKMGSDMVGVGVSSIGDVRGCFAQNVKKLPHYYQAIESGKFPIERGYLLSPDDELRREVITRLMCNLYLDVAEIEKRFGIDFAEYFQTELAELQAEEGPVSHGFLEVHADRLLVLEPGRLFIRNVCMIFDHYLRTKKSDGPVFSRTI